MKRMVAIEMSMRKLVCVWLCIAVVEPPSSLLTTTTLLHLLHHVQAPGWPAGSHATLQKTPLPVPAAVIEPASTFPPPTTEQGALIGRAIAAAAARLVAAKEELDAADALVGDADCGSTLALGAAAMQEDMGAGRYPLDDPVALCAALGRSCRAMGGSSGALYEIFFTAAAGAEEIRMYILHK